MTAVAPRVTHQTENTDLETFPGRCFHIFHWGEQTHKMDICLVKVC